MYPNFLQNPYGSFNMLQQMAPQQPQMAQPMGQPQQAMGQPVQPILQGPGGQPGQQQGGHGGGGFSPLMMLSPLAGMFMSGHPNMGLGMISPALGIASALGAFK